MEKPARERCSFIPEFCAASAMPASLDRQEKWCALQVSNSKEACGFPSDCLSLLVGVKTPLVELRSGRIVAGFSGSRTSFQGVGGTGVKQRDEVHDGSGLPG